MLEAFAAVTFQRNGWFEAVERAAQAGVFGAQQRVAERGDDDGADLFALDDDRRLGGHPGCGPKLGDLVWLALCKPDALRGLKRQRKSPEEGEMLECVDAAVRPAAFGCVGHRGGARQASGVRVEAVLGRG